LVEAAINSNETGLALAIVELVSALCMEIGGMNSEADVPAVGSASYRCEQDLGPRRDELLSGTGIVLPDRAK
jgi:hypothetical protein